MKKPRSRRTPKTTRLSSSNKSSSSTSLLVEDAHVWTGNGLRDASILVENERIARIARRIDRANADNIIDGSGLLALPGLVDPHVHLRDLNLSYKEDFTTGTMAAAAGGYTTVLDMPNTIPPTDSPERLRQKKRIAERKILVNVGFHVAFVQDRQHINAMARLGAMSMKLYMPHPIAPLDINREDVLGRAMRKARRARLPVTVHAEEPAMISQNVASNRRDYFLGLVRDRPPEAETRAVERILALSRRTGCRVHFCHVSLASTLRMIRGHGRGTATSEVTPHHLLLSEDTLRSREAWKAWMVPPLRGRPETRKLLRSLGTGLVSMVASDHAPHRIEEKKRTRGKTGESPPPSPGVPGLETSLRLMLTLLDRRALSLQRLVELLSTSPSRVFRLSGKGQIEPGYDGDIVLVDLKHKQRIRADEFYSKAKYSPFEGMTTRGKARTTIVGGRVVFQQDEIVSKPGLAGAIARPSPQ